MVHLDIKPANIFIKQGRYKLGDFGLVSPADTGADVEEGDSRYMALELLQDGAPQRDLTKCDIFSLGCTLYEICLGEELPLSGEKWVELREGKLSRMPGTPPELTAIVAKMLAVRLSVRRTTFELN
jgi:wee1-like protein kinase